MWRRALRAAPQDSVDTNQDGYISMTEAYNWIAPRSQAAGEHSMFDDNGDGVGHEWGTPGYDPEDPTKDGYIGNFYSLDGWFSEQSAIADRCGEAAAAPDTPLLEPSFPNPFCAGTSIGYTLPRAGPVKLLVCNPAGQTVRRLVVGRRAAGHYRVSWQGLDDAGQPVESGVYFSRLLTGYGCEARRLLLVR
jgi:hypothetical protein